MFYKLWSLMRIWERRTVAKCKAILSQSNKGGDTFESPGNMCQHHDGSFQV
jgi:hypothetical protein